MTEPMKTMGAYLQRCRKAAGFTQENIADKLEVNRRTVQFWEAGEEMPGGDSLMRLAALISADPREIQRIVLDIPKNTASPYAELDALGDSINAEDRQEFWSAVVRHAQAAVPMFRRGRKRASGRRSGA